jgi:hypothetical protein
MSPRVVVSWGCAQECSKCVVVWEPIPVGNVYLLRNVNLVVQYSDFLALGSGQMLVVVSALIVCSAVQYRSATAASCSPN